MSKLSIDNKKISVDHWEETISSRRPLFSINLKEIWRYRDLIVLFVRRDFVSQYKQTILGPIWLFLQPLFTTLTFYVVFSKIAAIPTNDVDPILFYLSGITLWNYFSDCFTKTSNTFTMNAGIFGKVYFPRLVSPISVIVSNLYKLGIQMLLFLAVLLFEVFFQGKGVQINTTLFLLPVLILLMAILGLGMGIIFSSLTTKYRDLSFLLAFGVQLLMYASPVIYPLSFTSGRMRALLEWNPLTPIMENFRYAFFSTGSFDWGGLGYTTLFSLLTLFFGVVIFNQVEKNFMDTV
jgi:lipopolysaccharide transport system permease protein